MLVPLEARGSKYTSMKEIGQTYHAEYSYHGVWGCCSIILGYLDHPAKPQTLRPSSLGANMPRTAAKFLGRAVREICLTGTRRHVRSPQLL